MAGGKQSRQGARMPVTKFPHLKKKMQKATPADRGGAGKDRPKKK